MQGSNFHLPILEGMCQHSSKIKSPRDCYLRTELNKEAVSYTELSKKGTAAFILGNEGQGVHPDILGLTDQNVYIPIYGQAESLNVAIAAGILMYFLSVRLFKELLNSKQLFGFS